jgi:hypothetical protein
MRPARQRREVTQLIRQTMFDGPVVGREETMAYWQIRGLLVLGAALAAITLAAGASAVPAQVAADRPSCAIIGGGGDGGIPTGCVLACCPRCTAPADA